MAGLALGLGWTRFAAVLLLCFYCAARPGEVLKALREDTLLPVDCLEEGGRHTIFLKVKLPKARKGGAKIQHCKMAVEPVSRFLEIALSPLQPKEPIFGGSPSSFRRRWDFVLEQIKVPRAARITPGSLRGGGAVWSYRNGEPLVKICWKMRITSISTLGYYLQEVAADC